MNINCLLVRTIAMICMTLPLPVTSLFAQDAAENEQRQLASRIQELEAREQIRQLMHNYGRYLDERNFSAFASLFTEIDSEYVSGGQTVTGAEAIGKMLEDIITANPSGLNSPNFHVFFNENIQVGDNQATAFSQSAFVAPDDKGSPSMIFFATYDDVFVREDGVWKFKRRVVRGNLPAR